MWPWLAIGVALLLVPRLWPIWARYQLRRQLLHLPVFHAAYSDAPPDTIPPGLRDALMSASSELTSLGFSFLGFIQSREFGAAQSRVLAVLRHPEERTFATLGFAIAARNGVIVDFETLFTDGWWLRSINRRGHFVLAPHDTGRVADPYVATLAEQWRYHQGAVAFETTRTRRDGALDDLIRHRNAVEDEEHAAGVRAGFYRFEDNQKDARFTPSGAALMVQRMVGAAKRLTTAPPLTGVLAQRCPPDDMERKFQNILFVQAQVPKSRARWAFLLSLVAFALSTLAFSHSAWLLWLIPFLLLHEIGHWSAMRLFGHRDARIRFIPFLGAATLTTTQFRKLSHEMIVLLAGPVPGIVLGLALFQLIDFERTRYALFVAITLVTINGINLLPLHPLDGGRILHALVTAGRPRLDVALKAIAGLAFVAGAVILRDPTLAILAVLGFLVVRPGLKLAAMDNEVRRHPGFGPGLTPEARRRLIFEALPEPRPAEGNTWVPLVQQLEVSLSHGKPRLWPALPWALVYVACLGGLVAWGANVFATIPVIGGSCPPRTHATTLACDAPETANDIDWTRRAGGSITRNHFKLRSSTSYPYGAFVWCTGETAAIADLTQRLWETRAANELCPALPWEPVSAETKAQRDKARWTLNAISLGGHRLTREGLEKHLDRMSSYLTRNQKYDAETTRLYKASLDEGPDGDAHRQLAERIGRSPSESCKRFRIVSVHTDGDEGEDEDEDEDENKDSEGDAGAADAGAAPSPTTAASVPSTRLSVIFTSPADFAPLRRTLCEAGCQVDVLPYGSMDPRLRACF